MFDVRALNDFVTKHRRAIILAFFAVFFLIGLAAHNDYGVSADEPAMRKFGHDAYEYLFQGKPAPDALDWKFHGPIVQLTLAMAQRMMGYADGADIWFQRHALNFTLFFAGVVCFYFLAKKYLNDWKLALLGSAFLALSPRIFAHAFHNPKDMPAMVFFIVAVYTLLLVLERPTALRLVGHALATGILISLRAFGLLVPLLGFGYLLFDGIRQWRRGSPLLKSLLIPFGYGSSIDLATIAVWPLLWAGPVKNFIEAFSNSSTRGGGGLYLGQIIDYTPWHYVPVWIAVTTPLLYTALFLAGCAFLFQRAARRHRHFLLQERPRVIVLAWFFAPLVALVVLRVGIFNEWRHVMFLYPAFLLIGLEGLRWLLAVTARSMLWSRVVAGIVALSMAMTGFWMVRNHPFEYAYFSIPSRWVEGKFDLDYWSLSYRAGLEHILATDDRERITVYPTARTAVAAADTLPLAEWERLYFVAPEEADYILDNFAPSQYEKRMPEDKAVHSIVVDGIPILTIYKGPAPAGMFQTQQYLEEAEPL